MQEYFYWCGVVLNVCIACGVLLFLWVLALWPFVQAISLTRCTVKALGKDRKTPVLKVFWWAYKELFTGKRFTTIRFDLFEWSDVGDWHIYHKHD